MKELLSDIRQCTICEEHLPLGANPVLRAHPNSKIAIIGQAPGHIVHNTGIPWNDRSGDRLRQWMNVSKEEFYDEEKYAIVPMGFCYPGTGQSGDLPPRKECARTWHQTLFDHMPNISLFLLVGAYANRYYLGKERKKNLTKTVHAFHEYLPRYFPLPHPSGRNNHWLKKNPWFESEVVPYLQNTIKNILSI